MYNLIYFYFWTYFIVNNTGRGLLFEKEDNSLYEGEFVNDKKCGYGIRKFLDFEMNDWRWRKGEEYHDLAKFAVGDVYDGMFIFLSLWNSILLI